MMNSVTIHARLSRDPEVKVVGEKSTKIANFSVYQRSSKDHSDFFDCEAMGAQASVVEQYLHKNDEVVIRGELRTNSWTTAEGNKRSKVVIRVRQISLVGSANRNNADAADGNEAPEVPSDFTPVNEPLPFG